MSILEPGEISQAQAIINRTPVGVYELSELYDSAWSAIVSPTTFGARFKETVLAGHLQLIRLGARKTNNHHTYEIFSKSGLNA